MPYFGSHDLIAFLLLSGLLVAVSHKPLRRPGSHGFYRYFAWQTMLVLIFLNRPEWGEHPETLHQQIATVLQMLVIVWVLLQAPADYFYHLVAAAAVFTALAGVQYVMDGVRQLDRGAKH